MTVELSAPTTHDANHEVDIVIENAPVTFCAGKFVVIGVDESDVRQLWEQLGEWLQTK